MMRPAYRSKHMHVAEEIERMELLNYFFQDIMHPESRHVLGFILSAAWIQATEDVGPIIASLEGILHILSFFVREYELRTSMKFFVIYCVLTMSVFYLKFKLLVFFAALYCQRYFPLLEKLFIRTVIRCAICYFITACSTYNGKYIYIYFLIFDIILGYLQFGIVHKEDSCLFAILGLPLVSCYTACVDKWWVLATYILVFLWVWLKKQAVIRMVHNNVHLSLGFHRWMPFMDAFIS